MSMSKEMEIIELAKKADRYLSRIDDLITTAERKAILRVINDYQRLDNENAALRENLRLKELECEALADDKDSLARDVKNCISELKAWADEFQDHASDDFIKETESRLREVVGNAWCDHA